MIENYGPKHLRVYELKHYLNSIEVCAFLGHIITTSAAPELTQCVDKIC